LLVGAFLWKRARTAATLNPVALAPAALHDGLMKILLLPLGAAFLIGATPAPSPQALKASITSLVGFGTRHTLSTTTDPRRGIGAARRWAAGEFARDAAACGGCLAIETIGDTFTGARAPNGVRVEDVLAIQKGTTDPDRIIIVQGHIDSRVSDTLDATSDAPGANDNASGTALVLETARLLSKEKFSATIVYAVLSGEEQGLWGGQLLARTAKARGWKIAAVLNNDIVGGTHGIGGEHVTDVVRVFSEGIRAVPDPTQRGNGGEDDSPSRSLAKAVTRVATAQKGIGLKVFAIRRPDRFGRGGDHTPFLEAGYPAVRFTEPTEHYDREHQNLRTENGRVYGDTIDWVDFPYLARVTALNMAVIRELANAPGAPANVLIGGAVSDDTHISWDAVPGAAGYRIRWRRGDTFAWTDAKDVPASTTAFDLRKVNIDDHFFGVSALSAKGEESVVTFGGMPARAPVGSSR
jgi:hypothetical protein